MTLAIVDLGKTADFIQELPNGLPACPGISLEDYIARIRMAVIRACPQPEWIRVDLSGVDRKGGHTYLELTQHDDQGHVIAKVRGVVWSSAQSILRNFTKQSGIELSPGIKLLILGKAQFSEKYGLTINVSEIDAAYTMGDMAAALKLIREKLVAEQLYGRNKSLPFPTDFFHVVVISPSAAAGLGDFKIEADRLVKANICKVTYLTALFQGAKAAQEVAAAIDKAIKLHSSSKVDAIAIIRGGGAASDFFWLNEINLARLACACPIPIMTGIGHEKDNTILDEIACRRCDTPSKVAHLIFTSICETVQKIQKNRREIVYFALQRLSKSNSDLMSARKVIKDGVRRTLKRGASLPVNQIQTIADLASLEINRAGNAIESTHQFIKSEAVNTIGVTKAGLSGIYQEIMTRTRMVADGAGTTAQLYHQTVQNTSVMLMRQAGKAIDRARSLIRQDVIRKSASAARDCDDLMENVLALSPRKTICRGYALVRSKGKVVTSIKNLNEDFCLEMKDGTIGARRIGTGSE